MGGCSGDDDKSAAKTAVIVDPTLEAAPADSAAPSLVPASPKPKPTKGSPQPNTTWTPTSKPSKVKPAPVPTTVKPGAVQKKVTAGAFCSPEGATGKTKAGEKLTCKVVQGDERARWRA
ncbi:hypothetical protein Adu01nite_19900 [Paractinoplanes durhamensis]|uniref:Uncharacterized protein n=2 Tax=Paractinoplanes durhamensis TaxID=113563 RepID=A0ABQ3YSY8_9ACTN|nr:hypothetical protein Adu01nite_19900 [Actinoplanes durhamensis]